MNQHIQSAIAEQTSKPVAEIKLSIGNGHYTLIRRKSEEDEGEIIADFDNLITDGGLQRLLADSSQASYCYLGTGSTAPVQTQDTMPNAGAYTSTTRANVGGSSYVAGPPSYFLNTVYWRFDTTQGNGVWSEMGIGNYESSTLGTNKMFSRSLILDGSGQPTTITKVAGEILDVVYTWRIYVDTTPVTGDIVAKVSGVDTTFNYKLAMNNLGQTYGCYGTSTLLSAGLSDPLGGSAYERETSTDLTSPSGLSSPIGAADGSDSGSSRTLGPYNAGLYYRDLIYTLPVGTANFPTGIQWLGFVTYICCWNIRFTPKLPKNSSRTISLTFRISVQRYA